MGKAEMQFAVSLCADDFALTPGVTRGIIELLDAGRLTATSAIATSASWPEGARALQQFKHVADIGLHLNLTRGNPLGLMPAFAPFGQFPALGKVLTSAVKRELPETEIGQEVSRQIDKFCEHFGSVPDFVDGHYHVQVLPQVRAQLFACLEEKGLLGKVWLRNSSDQLLRILRRNTGSLKKALVVAWLGKGFAKEAEARGFVTNDGFAGFSAFHPQRDYAADFALYLHAPGKRHLIMCHPGYCDEELAAADPVNLSREQELRFLLSPAFAQTLERNGARLARLSDCLARN
ncbi:MAG: ChbG/HpnK family deacetylase [Beijerinckiaceae bacterium]|nr:ChbG/HpnK family deacetylase [Beijerinckiaceae bacterium]MCI0735516.1 ChbG/HpnK family deacetylase [Beijerinckiaceae bacterium]